MKIACIAFVLICSLLASAQEFTAPIRVNSDTTGADREPWMHVGSNGSIYVSWVKVGHDGKGNAYFTRSDDGGNTFLPSVQATIGASIPPDNQRGAPFTIDTKGNIHTVWVEMRFKSPEDEMQSDVFYIRSTDNGATWSSEIVVSDDSLKYSQDFPSLASDSSGNVYLSYLDSRERAWGGMNEQLYMRKSSDNGMTWTPARRVNQMPGGIGGTCECCKQDIQGGLNGLVTIAFRSNINNRRDIFSIRSTDYGETFSQAVPIQSEVWTIPSCPVTGPNTSLTDNGYLYAVWRDARDAENGNSHVYVAQQLADEPVAYNIKLDREGETLPNWPDFAIYSGVQAIVYETNNKGLQYSVSSPHELPSFYRSQVHFKGNRQQFGNVAFAPSNGDRYILWQENRTGTNDIYFTRDTFAVNFGSVSSDKISDLFIAPNPVWAGEAVTIALPENTDFESYQLVDITGKVVAAGAMNHEGAEATIAIPQLPSGSYILRLLSTEKTVSQLIMVGN